MRNAKGDVYKRQELRVGAFYCRDERMLDTYRKNGDIHAGKDVHIGEGHGPLNHFYAPVPMKIMK